MGFVPLTTSRLIIAPPSHFKMEGHFYLRDLLAIYSDPEVAEYLNMGDEMDNEDIMDIINEENEVWQEGEESALLFALDASLDQVVGIAKVQPSPLERPRDVELVYAVHPHFRRHGYAEEIAVAVLKHEFAQGRRMIIGRLSPSNIPSRDLLLKLGFRRGEDRVPPDLTLDRIEHVYEKEANGGG